MFLWPLTVWHAFYSEHSISCPSQLACKCCLSTNVVFYVMYMKDTYNAFILLVFIMFCLARFALHQLLPRRNSTRICWMALSTSTRHRWSIRRRKKRTPYRLLKVYFCCFIIYCICFVYILFIWHIPACCCSNLKTFLLCCLCVTIYYLHAYFLFMESRTSGSSETINLFKNNNS